MTLRPGESQEELLRRWRKAVTKSGVLKAVRKRRWFISKSERRRLAKARVVHRARGKAARRRW
ncbi:MAG: 30S ribosomal protein S21 [Chloroflexi bacterium B3_Chlor]|nr:MAG: 30S ribosomal protein S21 [Chloroflexi bacterium B3_Chlor]